MSTFRLIFSKLILRRRIHNDHVQHQFDMCKTTTLDPHIEWVFHSSSVENLFSITEVGFKAPESAHRQVYHNFSISLQ